MNELQAGGRRSYTQRLSPRKGPAEGIQRQKAPGVKGESMAQLRNAFIDRPKPMVGFLYVAQAMLKSLRPKITASQLQLALGCAT